MGRSKLIIGVIMSAGFVSAPAQVLAQESVENIQKLIIESSLSIQPLIEQLIADYPDSLTAIIEALIITDPQNANTLVANFLQVAPQEQVQVIVDIAIKAVPDDQAASIVVAALQAAPQFVDLILIAAELNGIDNQAITIAAIENGVDPSVLAEPTASGVPEQESVAFPNTEQPSVPTQDLPVSPS